MSLLCLLGIHDWKKNCEKCSDCGKTREAHHNWSEDPDACASCGLALTDLIAAENANPIYTAQPLLANTRDGIQYKTIKIGSQIILAENLRSKMEPGNYWAYKGDEEKAKKYGYLYNWKTACKTAENLDGWHLPTKGEWETLLRFIRSKEKNVYKELPEKGRTGFNSLFGGFYDSDETFFGLGTDAAYWSASPEDENNAWYFDLNTITKDAGLGTENKSCGFSIRLFKDDLISTAMGITAGIL